MMLVRTLIPLGPICLIMIGEMPSGPSALELLDFLIASVTCCVDILTGFDLGFCLSFLIVGLACFFGFEDKPGVYCWLNL